MEPDQYEGVYLASGVASPHSCGRQSFIFDLHLHYIVRVDGVVYDMEQIKGKTILKEKEKDQTYFQTYQTGKFIWQKKGVKNKCPKILIFIINRIIQFRLSCQNVFDKLWRYVVGQIDQWKAVESMILAQQGKQFLLEIIKQWFQSSAGANEEKMKLGMSNKIKDWYKTTSQKVYLGVIPQDINKIHTYLQSTQGFLNMFLILNNPSHAGIHNHQNKSTLYQCINKILDVNHHTIKIGDKIIQLINENKQSKNKSIKIQQRHEIFSQNNPLQFKGRKKRSPSIFIYIANMAAKDYSIQLKNCQHFAVSLLKYVMMEIDLIQALQQFVGNAINKQGLEEVNEHLKKKGLVEDWIGSWLQNNAQKIPLKEQNEKIQVKLHSWYQREKTQNLKKKKEKEKQAKKRAEYEIKRKIQQARKRNEYYRKREEQKQQEEKKKRQKKQQEEQRRRRAEQQAKRRAELQTKIRAEQQANRKREQQRQQEQRRERRRKKQQEEKRQRRKKQQQEQRRRRAEQQAKRRADLQAKRRAEQQANRKREQQRQQEQRRERRRKKQQEEKRERRKKQQQEQRRRRAEWEQNIRRKRILEEEQQRLAAKKKEEEQQAKRRAQQLARQAVFLSQQYKPLPKKKKPPRKRNQPPPQSHWQPLQRR